MAQPRTSFKVPLIHADADFTRGRSFDRADRARIGRHKPSRPQLNGERPCLIYVPPPAR